MMGAALFQWPTSEPDGPQGDAGVGANAPGTGGPPQAERHRPGRHGVVKLERGAYDGGRWDPLPPLPSLRVRVAGHRTCVCVDSWMLLSARPSRLSILGRGMEGDLLRTGLERVGSNPEAWASRPWPMRSNVWGRS